MVLGPLIGAAVLGGLSYLGAEKANASNRSIASAQMAFQAGEGEQGRQHAQDMQNRAFNFDAEQATNARAFAQYNADTAYQRGMADMRKAGLNPMLAFAQGGAATPTSPAGHGSAPTQGAMPGASTRVENSLSGAVASAAQGARLVTEVEQQLANVDQTKAQTGLVREQQHQVRANTALDTARAISEGVRPDLIRAQTRTEQGRPALVGAQTAAAGSSARLMGAQTETERERPELTRAQTGATIHRGNVDRATEHNLRTYGPQGPVSSTIGGISQTLNSIYQSLRRSLQ